MKTKSKALLLTLCAVLLVTASVLGTMAYLTSTDSVENTFTVGSVAITLDEAKVNVNGQPVDKDGKVVDLKNAPRVDANAYKLMPGHKYTKDPTVHVAADSEDSWIFVKVENGIYGYVVSSNKIEDQIAANGWTALNGVANVYYKAYTKTNTVTDLAVFGEFEIVDNADSVEGWGGLATANVTVTAYAIQADGFTDANAAWTAGGFGTTTGE